LQMGLYEIVLSATAKRRLIVVSPYWGRILALMKRLNFYAAFPDQTS
jgi:hypothetical protein